MTAADGSSALGAPEVAGSFVNARGLTKKLTAGRAGSAANEADEGAPEVPSFGRVGYLSVTGDEIAIVRTKAAFRTTITDVVLARVPRSAIASVVFDAGVLLSHLTISFDNAVVWEFDIPRVNKRTAEAVVRELGGSA
ncbi:MAG: hypothetical protein QOH15_2153 [Gaiellales bacterium]|nr:hypothetical protein [Gaiellales bacterium]